MRVLYIIPMLACGGAEILLGNICEELDKTGHVVKVLYLKPPDATYINFPNREHFIKIASPQQINYRIKASIIYGLKVESDDLKKVLDEFHPDVVHTHLFMAEIVGRAHRYPRAVYFSHGHDNMFQLEPLWYKTKTKRKWFNFLERYWLLKQYRKFNNNFVAISRDAESFFKRSLPSSMHHRITLQFNAIKTEKFSGYLKKVNAGEKLMMVSTGNLVPKKNHAFLLDVGRFLRNSGVDFHLDVLGYGPLMQELKEKCTLMGLSAHIKFRGNVGNVPEILSGAHLYLHPATYEPFGLALIEAMASGLPVICLNGKGNLDIIRDGENGYLIDPPDALFFARRIIELQNSPDLYRRMGQNALDFSKQFDIGSYTRKLLVLYQQAMDRRIKS